MQTAKLVLDYVRVILWPLVILGLAFGFRGGIKKLLDNVASRAKAVTEVTALGVTAKFSEVEARREVAADLLQEADKQVSVAGEREPSGSDESEGADAIPQNAYGTYAREDRDEARRAVAMRLLSGRNLPPAHPTSDLLFDSAMRAQTTFEVQEGLRFAVTLAERYFRLLASDVYALDVAKLQPGLKNTVQAISRSPLAAMQWDSVVASAIATEGVVQAVDELADMDFRHGHDAAYQAIRLLAGLCSTADRLARLTIAEVKRWISRRPDLQTLLEKVDSAGMESPDESA